MKIPLSVRMRISIRMPIHYLHYHLMIMEIVYWHSTTIHACLLNNNTGISLMIKLNLLHIKQGIKINDIIPTTK